jgi:hypothetical protein
MDKFNNFFTNSILKLNTRNILILLFLISLFKNGIWYHPALWNMLEIAKNPFENVFGLETQKYYLYSSWLSPFFAYILGIKSKIYFFIFHLFLAILYLFLTITLIKKSIKTENLKKSLIIFLIFPVSMTSFYWVGYDSLILLLMVISLYKNRNYLITFMCSIGIGLQHFEIGFVSIMVIFIASIFERIFYVNKKKIKISFIFKITFITGLIIGKIILYKIYNDESFVDGRLQWISDALLHLLYNFYFNFYNILWFSLGAGWLIIIHFFLNQKQKWPFLISLFALIFVLPFVDDHSRVFSACSFMLIMIYILCNDEFLDTVSLKQLSLFFLIWILLPYSWVWQGDLRSTMFLYDFAYILEYTFGIFNNEIESSTIWPFERFK